jgi:hypothetical protein
MAISFHGRQSKRVTSSTTMRRATYQASACSATSSTRLRSCLFHCLPLKSLALLSKLVVVNIEMPKLGYYLHRFVEESQGLATVASNTKQLI